MRVESLPDAQKALRRLSLCSHLNLLFRGGSLVTSPQSVQLCTPRNCGPGRWSVVSTSRGTNAAPHQTLHPPLDQIPAARPPYVGSLRAEVLASVHWHRVSASLLGQVDCGPVGCRTVGGRTPPHPSKGISGSMHRDHSMASLPRPKLRRGRERK